MKLYKTKVVDDGFVIEASDELLSHPNTVFIPGGPDINDKSTELVERGYELAFISSNGMYFLPKEDLKILKEG